MVLLITVLSFLITALETKHVFSKKRKFKQVAIFIIGLIVFLLSISKYFSDKLEEVYSKNSGVIDGSLYSNKIIYPSLAIGGTIFTNTGGTKIFGDLDLDIWIAHHQLYLTTSIRDTLNNIIAKIVANEWQVNPNFIYDRNFDDRSIEIIDNKGHVLLKAFYDGEKVNIEGVFFFKDVERSNVIGIEMYPYEGGAVFSWIHKGQKINYPIKPMFLYPSERHHGKKVKPEVENLYSPKH